MPRRRNHSNGINDSAPNVNRVAPEEQGGSWSHALHLGYECEAPRSWPVRTRQAMPPISFLCMSHYPMARFFSPTEKLTIFWSGFV